METSEDPVREVLNAVVYAPLGLALQYRKLMPELAEAGRRQITFARSLGKMAFSTAAKAAQARGTQAQPAPVPAAAAHEGDTRPAVAERAQTGSQSTQSPDSPKTTHAAVARTLDEIFDDYDSLTARVIVGRLGDLSAEERGLVASYEKTHRNRVTILKRVAQLA